MDKKAKIGVIVGVIATPVVIVLAVGSGGAGHGDYLWARVFYPLLTFIMLAGAGGLVVPFALVQYPFYGWYIGRCISRQQFIRLAVILLILQIIPMLIMLL
jgi:hypothetical protein